MASQLAVSGLVGLVQQLQVWGRGWSGADGDERPSCMLVGGRLEVHRARCGYPPTVVCTHRWPGPAQT